MKTVVRQDACCVKQWLIPARYFLWKHLGALPPKKIINDICQIVNDEVKPDLIHVWGTERFWGLLTARKYLAAPALLEIQGVKHAIGPYIAGGLTAWEQFSCIGVKEILMPSLSLFSMAKSYIAGAKDEIEMLEHHDFIDYQSEWTHAWIVPYIQEKLTFRTKRMIRPDFLTCKRWQYKEGNHIVFSSCGLTSANKGAHILIRAFAIVHKVYPDAELHLTGVPRKGIHLDGFTRFLLREIKQLRLTDCVKFLGALSAAGMIDAMRESAVGVVPSFVESYSASLAEGMAVGVPMIASYAGAMPEVGGDGVLYAPIGDAGVLANRIWQVFEMKEQVKLFTDKARDKALAEHNPQRVLERQMEIYDSVFMKLEGDEG